MKLHDRLGFAGGVGELLGLDELPSVGDDPEPIRRPGDPVARQRERQYLGLGFERVATAWAGGN